MNYRISSNITRLSNRSRTQRCEIEKSNLLSKFSSFLTSTSQVQLLMNNVEKLNFSRVASKFWLKKYSTFSQKCQEEVFELAA